MPPEIHRGSSSRLDVLKRSGVPKRLWEQMLPSGIQRDYGNKWFAPFVTLERFNPHSPDNELGEPYARPQIQQAIRNPITYTDYWKKRLASYNERQRRPTDPRIDKSEEDRLFDLLVTQQPETLTLDSLAEAAHDLAADETIQPADLVRGYVRLAAQVYPFLNEPPEGHEAAERLLREYGINPGEIAEE
jgi:hypothetical protein